MLRRHRPMVWRMCWLRSRGDYEHCRDLVQEVCLSLWLHYDNLRPGSTLHEERAWVRWQTRSTLDLLNRRRRPPMLPLTAQIADTMSEVPDNPFGEEMEELLATLNPDERRMVQLQLEGYRAKEIAQVMGLNRDVVYQRMHRAVLKARRVLLFVLLLVLTSGLAIAVVPQWRKAVIGSKLQEEPVQEEPTEVTKPVVKECEEMPEMVDTVQEQHVRICYPIPRKMAPMQEVDTFSIPPLPALRQHINVSVVGNAVTVSGLRGERVSLRSRSGILLASQKCHGVCFFQLFPNDGFFMDRYDYVLQIGDTLLFDIHL